MATYYGTYGQKVQYLASDPSDPQIGQVWYNSTSATLKVRSATTSGSWASGGAVGTARYASAQWGTPTAAVIVGGFSAAETNAVPVESYNGTSWTASPTLLNTPRMYATASGPQTASIIYGGDQYPSPRTSSATETWNGTSFTTQPSLNTARSGGMGAAQGTQTATLYFGGATPANSGATESYNGSSWTTLPATLNTAGNSGGGAGIQTAALAFARYPNSAVTESWNGSNWTNVNSLNTARDAISGTGLQTAALAYAGTAPAPANVTGATESWNGTSWTTQGSMSTARYLTAKGNSGTTADALAVSGQNGAGSQVTNTEEYTGPGVGTTKTVTVS